MILHKSPLLLTYIHSFLSPLEILREQVTEEQRLAGEGAGLTSLSALTLNIRIDMACYKTRS